MPSFSLLVDPSARDDGDPGGKRDPQAFFSTDITLEPVDIIALYVRRWQIEVTFAETRAHLGVETKRQWTDNAIARTTPALLGLYSLISLWACDLLATTSIPYAAAWYRKKPVSRSVTLSLPSAFSSGSAILINAPRRTENRTIFPHPAWNVWLKLYASLPDRTKSS